MPQVNGDSKRSSLTLEHLKSYPVINDSIDTFKSNPYGKKSLELADGVYTRFGKPVEPYLETPYSYAAPYVAKADELAASGLEHVDSHFPIVKEDTSTIVEKGKSVVWWPFELVGQGKDYVLGTWNDEYKKTASHKDRGPGVSTSVLALISTELKIASDFFQTVADFLGPKYEESKKKGGDYVRAAEDSVAHYKQLGEEKVGEFTKLGQAKADEAKKVGQEKTEQVKERAGQK